MDDAKIKYSIFKKIASFGVKIFGVFLFLFSLAGVIQGLYGFKDTINLGSTGFVYNWSNVDSVMIIREFQRGFNASDFGFKVGDSIVQVNGYKLNKNDYDEQKIWGESKAGTKFVISIKNGNNIQNFELTRQIQSLFDRLIMIAFYIIMPLLMMVFVLTGLWGLIKNPYSLETNLIGLVCFSFGNWMYSPIDLLHISSFISKYLYFYEIKDFLGYFLFFVPCFWLFLFSIFPRENEFYKSHKVLSLSLIFALPVIVLFCAILQVVPIKIQSILFVIAFANIFVGILIGILVLTRNSKREMNVLRKRQFRMILFGIKFGGLSIISGYVALMIFGLLKEQLSSFVWIFLPAFLVSQVCGIIIPFTFFNSFRHNKLLETETELKKKVRYLSLTFILFFTYLAVIFLVVKLFIINFQITDTSLTIIFVLVVATTFYPINSKLLKWLERKIYPEKTKYQEALKGFIKKLPGFIEIVNLLENLSMWMEENMRIKSTYVYALDAKNSGTFPIKINQSNSIFWKIKDGSSFFWDEIVENSDSNISDEEKKWALSNGVSITIPMISYGELVGVLNVGKKSNHEDFSGTDLELFKEISNQTALSLQNIKLHYEYIEKKRMDKELDVARKIQTQLLPQSIPSIEGMKLFGKMKPCFEVAGDYFDIIPIDKKRTVLAIGDVSGKGAGAALLMANLQAGLRAALRFTDSLPDIVFEINNIINQNTNPAQFITFFIGMWDSETNIFQYVNAGHNPAILLKSDGTEIKLSATGMFLGPIPNGNYETEKISFSHGDILTIYTDGIEETFNTQDEQFGSERILQILQENKDLDPNEIVNILFKKTEEFSQGTPVFDDSTVIIAKII